MSKKNFIPAVLLTIFISACSLSEQNNENKRENLERENISKSSLDYMPKDTIFLIDLPDYQNQKDFFSFIDLQYSQSTSFALLLDSEDNIDMILSQKVSDINQIENLKSILNNSLSGILESLNSEQLNFEEINNSLIASNSQSQLDQIDSDNFESIKENQKFQLANRDFENEDSFKMLFLPENFFTKESTIKYAYIEALDDQNLTGKIMGNQERMDELEVKFNESAENQFYLFNAIDLNKRSIIIEGYDLKADIEKNLKIEENVQIQESFEDIKNATGIDIQSDVISWMNEAYIFDINQNNFTLIFDVKSNREKALSLITKIKDLINSIASFQAGLNINFEFENLSENSYLLKIKDLESLGFFTNENSEINISFGISEDNLLFISNKENLANEISRNFNNKAVPEGYEKGQNLVIINQNKEDKIILKTKADEYFIDIEGVLVDELYTKEL